MPRSLVLGNGTLLATFDATLQLRDLYFPFVGMEDHTTYGKFHRVGFFLEGKGISWLDDGSWQIVPGYMESSLVSSSTLRNERLGLAMVSEDFVDPTKNILVRSFRMTSTDGETKHLKCFFHHDFHLYGEKQKDTAFFEPHTKSIIHYRQNRYFLVSGTTSDPVACEPLEHGTEFHPLSHDDSHIDHCGPVSFAVGKSNYRGLEGTWRDAEDGQLSRSSIEQGSVDSTMQIDCMVHPDRETTLHVWLCAGRKISEVHALQHFLLEETPEQVKQAARNYWKGWTMSHVDPGPDVPQPIRDLYWRSLLTVRTQIDNHGGILAANDSDIMQFNRDTYTYVWPRDGAFVSMALTKANEHEAVYRFLKFCERVQTTDGYFLHKYNPDGSAGSSWHPWFKDGHSVVPIQGDETALPLVALWKHFEQCQDFEFLHQMYQTFVRKAADFLIRYTEPETGLPLASYDLWEEQRGVFSYTTATTIAGLRAAGNISMALGHYRHAQRYNEAADRMREAMLHHLYDESTQCFFKKIQRVKGETVDRDPTPDASLALLWTFGILPPDDPRMVSTMKRLQSELTVRSHTGGIARYVNDHYQAAVQPSREIPGNPWIITTLWIAQWQLATAKTAIDLQAPLKALHWAVSHASKSGILAEQLHPLTAAPLSVAPLTWSHAVFVETVLMYAEALRRLKILS